MTRSLPKCRLYLQVPAPFTAMRKAQIARALEAVSPACVLLTDNGEALKKVPNEIDPLIDLIQGTGAACLLESTEAAADLGADGVHIPADLESYEAARAVLGISANIGVACGRARHDAMEFAEAGADYVAFGAGETGAPSAQEALAQEALPQEALPQEALPQEALPQEALPQEALPQEASTQETLELVTWWSGIFVIPCVAWSVESIADATTFAQAGVDFIAPPAAIFDRDDAIERLVEMDRAIRDIRRAA